MNIIQIMGNLGSDPETRVTPDGQKVTSFRVAVNTRKGGNDETIWYRVTVWGDRFDKMMAFLKKGSGIMVIGRLSKPQIYTDKEGKQQVSLDVTADMLFFPPSNKQDRANEQTGNSYQANTSYGNANSYQANPSYGNANPYQGASTGQNANSSYSQLSDDDALPF